MAATPGQIIAAAARWSDEGYYIQEFVAKNNLPAIVKIIKGQYSGLGVPTLPSPGLQSIALLVSVGKRQKILAQAVKIKEGKRLVSVGPRLVIPDSYSGYFELLSEEGRAVRCIDSVSELSRRRAEGGCLVRETIRAVQAKIDPQSGSVSPEGARTIPAGEILVPFGEISLPGSKNRYLKCLDPKGDTLLLGLEQRGKFSILAREDNISGVHTVKNLLSKRLPLTVRLVHGTAPRGIKSPSQFVPEIRLLSIVEEEHIFAVPLQKDDQNVVALPLIAPLKLLKTKNEEILKGMVEYNRLVERVTKLATEVCDRIQTIEGKLGESKKLPPTHPPDTRNGFLLRRSASSDSTNHKPKHSHRRDENFVPISKNYDEIDQIYDYVRGVAPLPKNIRSPYSEPSPSSISHSSAPSNIHSTSDVKPEPPPIDTIPTKKLHAEKRNRKTSAFQEAPTKVVPCIEKTPPGLPKLFVKNGQSQRVRLLRQKSASPIKETAPTSRSKTGSPLFSIRYKSLNNLQVMELDGTLDSSNSGNDSGGVVKQPEKRSRKLSRPRSLTNLIWEVKEYPDITVPVIEKSKKVQAAAIISKNKHSKYTINSQRRGTLYL
ncbi:uncharacterized protein LOC123307282 [Coccinella septempunctata]|uniref:uncharacterized protein LOC123307282 n=1 Tax=Coccinella septempunctata TaxID=41139 RepID=UPI001D08F1F9|nr:uncharacterized protein LOC123307282 [Coccinella septempunctata]XP_044745458.1 uncharacterized protein LOC123307282 [Coccinella septempunctata]